MRTQDEIVARYEARKEWDTFGFETNAYLIRMDIDHARPYLVEGADESEWNPDACLYTRELVLERMSDYMPFAHEKADNERGISAICSIMHYIAWIWLIGDDEFLAEVEREYDDNYHSYGKPILAMIEKQYDLNGS